MKKTIDFVSKMKSEKIVNYGVFDTWNPAFKTGELNTMGLNDKIVEKTKIKENETK